MDPIPTHRCGARRPCLILHHHHHRYHQHHHHHRHHHHHHHHCHLFQHQHQHQNNQIHCLCNCHRHANPNLASFPQNPQFIPPCSFPNDLTSGFEEAHRSAHQMLEEHENGGLEEEEDDDDDDDDEPVFVLTDEWKEFFAKSEAARKLKKKQAHKRKT